MFFSVFSKRLTASPSIVPEYDRQQSQDIPEAPNLVERPINEVQDHPDDGNCRISSPDGAQLGVSSRSDETFELEKLLKEKTFTRAEFEQLSELLRSRMVESSQSIPGNNIEHIRKVNTSELTNKKQQMVLQSESFELPHEDDNIDGHGCLTPTLGNVIHEVYAASPAEIAKAYMGSRSSKAVPATSGIRNHTSQESRHLSNELSYGKPFDLPLVPSRSITGNQKVSDNNFTTPRIHGRSAMHRMSRSPFFKGRRANNAGPSTTYELTSTNIIQPGDSKTLKRRISDLDDGVASSGHIRRIRQKYQVTTLSKLSSGHTLPSWNRYGKDVCTGAVSGQNPLYLEERKYAGKDSTAGGEDAASPVSVVPVPLQSSEMARKIFQELDKMMPSPKEKSSEFKVAVRNESPSKLTKKMLHGSALKSMQKINSPDCLKSNDIGNLGAAFDTIQEISLASVTKTQDKGKENDFQNVVGHKVGSEAFDKGNSAIFVSDAKSSLKDEKFTASGVANFSSSNKPAFRISVPEDFVDLDEENNELEDSSTVAVRRDHKLDLMSASLPVNGEMAGPEKHTESSLKPVPMPATGSERDLDKMVSGRPIAENNCGLTLPMTPGSRSSFLQPVSSVSFENSDLPKEKVRDGTPLGTAAVLGNSAIKFGERSACSLNATLTEDKDSEKRNNCINGGGLFSTFDSASSGLPTSTSPVASYPGDSVSLGLTSDIPTATSKTPSVSVPAATGSNISVTSVANSTVTATRSSTTSFSTAAPVFSMNSPIQFGSSSSSQASKPFGFTTDRLNATTREAGSTSSPSFGINGVTPTASTPPFSAASNNSTLSSGFSNVSSSSSASSSSLFSSFGNSNSVPLSAGLTSTISSNGPQGLGHLFQTNSEPTSGISLPSQGSSSQFGSFTSTTVFGLSASSSSASASSSSSSSSPSLLAPAAYPNPLGLSSGFSFSTASSSFSSSVSNSSFAPTIVGSPGFSFSAGVFSPSVSGVGSSMVSGTSSSDFSFSAGAASSTSGINSSFAPATFGSPGFSFSAGVFSPSVSGSSSSMVTGTSSSGFSFSAGAASSSTSGNSTSLVPSADTSLFTSSASTASLSVFGSTFSSTTSSSTGLPFGSSALMSGNSPFGASSGSSFSFSSPGNANSLISPTLPNFGVPNQFTSHASGSPGNDQMNTEDSMADDPVQPAIPVVSAFGQPTSVPATPNFIFGSPAIPSSTSTFQFGNQQNFSMPQNPSPFQNSGNLEFAGGSFSLGSASDKGSRRIVRVKRDKHRKK